MDPKVIAEWVDEDMQPGRKGTIAESLYGIHVQPGDELIDRFIASVEANYLEFDPNDPKFQKAAARVFGKLPNPQQWAKLIQSSSQSDDLKQKLMSVIGVKPQATGGGGSIGRAIIQHNNGNTIRADAVVESKCQMSGHPILYIGINGPSDNGVQTLSPRQRDQKIDVIPSFWAPITITTKRGPKTYASKFTRKFEKVLTIRKDNIAAIKRVN